MVPAPDNPTLAPQTVTTRAQSRGRWPGAFGPRFLVALLVGLIWIGPAWWNLRFLYAMLAWDALLMFIWFNDWRRLPRPGDLEVSRAWRASLTQGTVTGITLQVRSSGKSRLYFQLEDDLPISLSVEKAASPPTTIFGDQLSPTIAD